MLRTPEKKMKTRTRTTTTTWTTTTTTTTTDSSNVVSHPPPPPAAHAVSVYMTVVLVFITHSMVNATLLSSWNDGLRCIYWNVADCSSSHSWILNWFSFGQLQVSVLIAALAQTALGNPLSEQRLAHLTCAVIASNLSSGIFMLDHLNRPMALLQGILYIGMLLSASVYASTSTYHHHGNNMMEEMSTLIRAMRSSSYDPRKKKSATTLVLAFLTILSSIQVLERVIHNDPDDDDVDVIFRSISNACLSQRMWTTLILGWSTAMCTVPQHKALLLGHALVLFVAQIMLAADQDHQGEQQQQQQHMTMGQARASSICNFCGLLVSLLGAY